MSKSIKFSVPIFFNKCKTKKSNWFLNLNNFIAASKNTSYRNSLKKKYSDLIKPEILKLENIRDPVKIKYTIFRHDNRKFDVANVGAIVDKFLCDVLVDCGVLIDDNYDYIKSVEYIYGGVDKMNPRAEIYIIVLTT